MAKDICLRNEISIFFHSSRIKYSYYCENPNPSYNTREHCNCLNLKEIQIGSRKTEMKNNCIKLKYQMFWMNSKLFPLIFCELEKKLMGFFFPLLKPTSQSLNPNNVLWQKHQPHGSSCPLSLLIFKNLCLKSCLTKLFDPCGLHNMKAVHFDPYR